MKGRMGLAFRDVGRGLLHRRDDVGIGGATADVAAHIFPDVVLAARMPFAPAGDRRHDLARRAVAALERILVDEGLLHRMQSVALGEPLDGGYVLAERG